MFKPASSHADLLNAEMSLMDVDQWKIMVARIDDPTTAKIIVECLDDDPVRKSRYAGIYIRARDTVNRSQVRYERELKRGQMFANFIGWISGSSRKRVTTEQAPASASVRKEPQSEPLVWPELHWPELRPQ